MFEQIDNFLLQATAGPVRIWCEWTGKSNFALAKLLLVAASVALVIFPGAVSFSSEGQFYRAVIEGVWHLPAVIVLFFLFWRPLTRMEKDFEKLSERPILPISAYAYVGPRGSVMRLFLLTLTIANFSFSLTDSAFATIWLGFIFIFLSHCVAANFNAGGGGRIKKRVSQAFRWVRNSIRPRIRPVPNPFPA